MPNKLIATAFEYRIADGRSNRATTYLGSYLGRTVASRATVRRFLNATIKSTGVAWRVLDVFVLGSSVSPWIAK